MEALGRLVDVTTGWTPVDLNTAGATGKRCKIGGNANGVMFVVNLAAAASGTESITLDVQQHTASASGTTSDLDVVTRYAYKSEATLDGDETWTIATQAAASEVTLTGATFAAAEMIVVIEVYADQLSDGYGYVSLTATDPGTVARLSSCNYYLYDLMVERSPAALAAPLS